MSISNSKFRNTREAPTEPFKRAVTSSLKAIARTPELDVTFAVPVEGFAKRFIGTRDDGGTGFEGRLDEVALYDRALEPAEIASHVRAARGK